MAEHYMSCTCCGGNAGYWRQWPNQDTEFGLCLDCDEWMSERGSTPQEMCETYGIPGRHRDGRKYQTPGTGLTYYIVAEYKDTEEGRRAANKFMERFASVGLLDVNDGRVILASMSDKGTRA